LRIAAGQDHDALDMNHHSTGEFWAFNLEIYAGT